MRASGLSRSTVIRSLRRLQDGGLVTVERHPESNRHRESQIGIAPSLLVPVADRTGVSDTSPDTSSGRHLRPGVYNVDCMDGMKAIRNRTVDLILTDLPHGGLTQNDWDCSLDLSRLWTEYRRINKPNGAIILTAASPFDKVLAMSNLSWFRHERVWCKDATGFLNAKYGPLKAHESVLVFCQGTPTYHPQMTTSGTPYRTRRAPTASPNYKGSKRSTVTVSDGSRYPQSVLAFDRDRDNPHPTGKPVALFEYLIRTYSSPGDLVLDNCMGSGTAAIACAQTKRRFIGMEKDPAIFAVATERIRNVVAA